MVDPVELPPLTPEEEASDDCLMDVIRGGGPDFLAKSGMPSETPIAEEEEVTK